VDLKDAALNETSVITLAHNGSCCSKRPGRARNQTNRSKGFGLLCSLHLLQKVCVRPDFTHGCEASFMKHSGRVSANRNSPAQPKAPRAVSIFVVYINRKLNLSPNTRRENPFEEGYTTNKNKENSLNHANARMNKVSMHIEAHF